MITLAITPFALGALLIGATPHGPARETRCRGPQLDCAVAALRRPTRMHLSLDAVAPAPATSHIAGLISGTALGAVVGGVLGYVVSARTGGVTCQNIGPCPRLLIIPAGVIAGAITGGVLGWRWAAPARMTQSSDGGARR